jgi:hypothetical protein
MIVLPSKHHLLRLRNGKVLGSIHGAYLVAKFHVPALFRATSRSQAMDGQPAEDLDTNTELDIIYRGNQSVTGVQGVGKATTINAQYFADSENFSIVIAKELSR